MSCLDRQGLHHRETIAPDCAKPSRPLICATIPAMLKEPRWYLHFGRLSCLVTRAAISPRSGEWVRDLLVGLLVLGAGQALAEKPENVTSGEMAMLPSYCVDTQTFGDGTRISYWVGIMGKGFMGLHHYCWGLLALGRAQNTVMPQQTRRHILTYAINDFNFTLKNAAADFVLAPEIYTRRGDIQLMLSDPVAAYESFERARELKPDYWPAYSRWADVLIKANQKVEAKKLVKVGLQYAPGSKVLLDQFKALGGNASEIEPLVKPAATPSEGQATGMEPPVSTESSSATTPKQ